MFKKVIQVTIVSVLFLGLFSTPFNNTQTPMGKPIEDSSSKTPLVMTKTVPDLKTWEWGQGDKPDDKIFDFEVINNTSGDLKPDIAAVSEDGNLYLFDGMTGDTIWMVHLIDSRLPSYCTAQHIFDCRPTLTSGDIDLDGTPEIIVSGLDLLASINSQNGEIEWQISTDGGFGTALLDSDDSGNATDIVVRSQESIHVFNHLGILLWETWLKVSIWDHYVRPYDPAIGEFDDVPGEDVSVGFKTYNGRTGTLYWESTMWGRLWDELVMGDFDNDGRDDFAGRTSNDSFNGIVVMSGNGTELWSYTTSQSVRLGVGDFNMDFKDDLAIAFWESELRVFEGDGTLIWGPVTVGQSHEIAITDLNSDSIDDIILGGNYGQIQAYEGGVGSLLWSRSVGGEWDNADLIAIADVDGDSVKELFIALKGEETYGQTRRWGDVFAFNSTGGHLWNTTSVEGYMTSVRQIVPADLTGDVIPDYLVSTAYDLIAIEGGTGDLLWHADPIFLDLLNEIATADVNSDGIDDMIYSTYDHLYALYGNNGSLIWEVDVNILVVSMVIDDVDNNGEKDILVAARDDGILKWVKGTDGTIIWEGTGFNTGSSSRKIHFANITLDATLDIVLVTGDDLQVVDGSTKAELFSKHYPVTHKIRDVEVAEMTGDDTDELIVSTTSSIEVINGSGVTEWTSDDFSGCFCVEDFTGDGIPDISNGKATIDGQDGSIIYSFPWPGELTIKPILVSDYSRDGFPDLVVVSGRSLKILDVHQPDVLFATYSEYYEISNVIRNSTDSLGLILSSGRAIYALPNMSELVHSLSKPIIAYPGNGDIITGEIFVVWSASHDPLGHDITYSLYYSTNNGNTWTLLSSDLSATNYQWNTTLYPESFNYQLKVVTTCSEGSTAESRTSGTFSVSHPDEPEPSTEPATSTEAVTSTEATTSTGTRTLVYSSTSTTQSKEQIQITPAWTTFLLLSSFAAIVIYKKFRKTSS